MLVFFHRVLIALEEGQPMNSQISNDTRTVSPSGWLATHTALATGLWIAAFGIFVQAASGAKGYPKVPPGILILLAMGLLVYFTSRWVWTAVLGLLLTGLITIGVFTTTGTADRLHNPQDIGPLIGTLVQLLGMLLAWVAGIAIIAARFLRKGA
jgi:hypothetical protein